MGYCGWTTSVKGLLLGGQKGLERAPFLGLLDHLEGLEQAVTSRREATGRIDLSCVRMLPSRGRKGSSTTGKETIQVYLTRYLFYSLLVGAKRGFALFFHFWGLYAPHARSQNQDYSPNGLKQAVKAVLGRFQRLFDFNKEHSLNQHCGIFDTPHSLADVKVITA